MIARLRNWMVEESGIYLPAMKELYYAEKGKGAYCNGRRIQVSAESQLANVLVAYDLDHSEVPGKTEREVRTIEKIVRSSRNLRATNSIVDDCYVAAGKLGAALSESTMIWDDAAPSLVVEEAGGVYTDIDGNTLDFNVTPDTYLKNFSSVSTSQALHAQVMSLVHK